MKYADKLNKLYKQANEDDDKDIVCNKCGKPLSGGCTCNGGKGASTKKEFLENELAKKLASEVLDEMYLEKQAAKTDLGPVDWGKQKTIPLDPSEYKVRDAKLGEAIGHNAKQGAKKAKAGAKAAGRAGAKGAKQGAMFAKNYGKLVKVSPALGVVPALAGLSVANNIHQYNKREKSRDNDTRTNAKKDKQIPEYVRGLKTLPVTIAGSTIGLTVGPRVGMKLGGRLANKVALKRGLQGEKALKAIGTGLAGGAIAGTVVPSLAAATAANEMKKRDSLKRLDKLSNKYLGRPATEAEKNVIKKRNKLTTPVHLRGEVTPESEIQKRRRAMAKEKKASDFLEELYMEKQAGNIAEAIKKNSKGHYCMHCEHSSKERFVREGHRGYSLGDVADKDASYLKCSKKDKFFHKEDGKDCNSFNRATSQEKQASEKWTNKDRKGFVRNMVINTAQDFVNAGNPLNVGSHITGSILDSAVMEGMTMKMNKKLQAQKINDKKLKHFNDAKGLSNGTTAVKAVKSTPVAVKKITTTNNN